MSNFNNTRPFSVILTTENDPFATATTVGMTNGNPIYRVDGVDEQVHPTHIIAMRSPILAAIAAMMEVRVHCKTMSSLVVRAGSNGCDGLQQFGKELEEFASRKGYDLFRSDRKGRNETITLGRWFAPGDYRQVRFSITH